MSYNPNVEVRTYDLPDPVRGGVAVDVRNFDQTAPHDHSHSLAQGHAQAHDVGFKTTPRKSLKWLRRFSIAVIVLSVIQIIFTILHIVKSINLELNIVGLLAGIAFLVFAVLYLRWAKRAKGSKKANKQKELLQPAEGDENATRRYFLAGALLAVVAITLGVNFYIQRGYNLDVNFAQQTSDEAWTWGSGYNTFRVESIYRYAYPILAVFQILFTLYFIFAARTTFRCLKFGNQAITTLIFIATLMTCIYGLNLLFITSHAQGYDVYPQLKAHFPPWVLKSLVAISITIVALSFITFLVNHRGWRVGFVLVGLLYIISTLFLVSLVGPSLHHTRKIYQYYNGQGKDSTEAIAHERLRLVDEKQIESWGCPAKYVDATNCGLGLQVTRWEGYPKNTSSVLRDVNATEPTATATVAVDPTTVGPVVVVPSGISTMTFLLEEDERALATAAPLYCLNTACQGVNGQLYANEFLNVSNFGLLTLLFSGLIVIGTGYFWYVNWIDRARKTSNDFYWAVAMAVFTIATVVVLIFGAGFPYIPEQLLDGSHQ